MRKFYPFCLLLFSILTLTSCGDSHKKLIEDEVSHIDELTAIINDLADGKTSEANTLAAIDEWAKQHKQFHDRLEALNADSTKAEIEAANEEFIRASAPALRLYESALVRLRKRKPIEHNHIREHLFATLNELLKNNRVMELWLVSLQH